MAYLRLENIDKIYDNGFHAVHDFNMEIKDGEFIVFVGPSGCGKSTTLRMIAGLEKISGGQLFIDDVCVNDINPKKRGVSMVFQSYALYPHMTVRDNIAFGLELDGYDKDFIARRVNSAAEVLGLTPYLARFPRELSGGQRQRVAVGRSIVRKPKVFLMDEPLSNLDAKQRVYMRAEIKNIHRTTKATSIYVTHDQVEAMTMADRIVVMKDGYVQQVGTPRELYFNPYNKFVAGFIGEPAMNFLPSALQEGKAVVEGCKGIEVSKITAEDVCDTPIVGFRAEGCSLARQDGLEVNGIVELTELLGDSCNVYVKLGDMRVVIRVEPEDEPRAESEIQFFVPYQNLYLFDSKTQTTYKRLK